MGVITQNERKLVIRSSTSEETLYIPSSDDDRSEISVQVRHARCRVLGHRIPTIGGSSTSIKANSGKKKSRRYQNVNQLMTLAEDDELKEVSITDFVESSRTPFTRLLEDESSLQKWEEFVSSSEETQDRVIQRETKAAAAVTPAGQLNANLRSLLKKRSLPLGMLHYLEDELIDFFLSMPKNIYISPKLSSFERLLLHGLSHYHRLISLSFNTEPGRIRLVQVKNPKDQFPEPAVPLTKYIESVYGL